VLAKIVMMGGLMMMVGGGVVMSRGLMMMLTGRMLRGLCHGAFPPNRS
jgi:predicted MFS family arabinose efflux permease